MAHLVSGKVPQYMPELSEPYNRKTRQRVRILDC
jgi:hypothetical protein